MVSSESKLNESLLNRLNEIEGLQIDRNPDTASTDFGGMIRGRVQAIAKPTSIDAIASLVKIANQEHFALMPRACGWSQSGQSIPQDGLSVDMRGLKSIKIDSDRGIAHCGGGVSWRELIAETAPLGWMPQVHPFNLDLSIGGTLSAGGMGSTGHRYGMALSSVESAIVVTGAGERVETSAKVRSEVLEAVLGGIGQFGLICAIALRLKPILPRLKTWFLLYDDLPKMLADERKLSLQPWVTHLEGYTSAAFQGVKLNGDRPERIPFARWFYGLQISEEYTSGFEQTPRLSGLNYRELLHVQDDEAIAHASRYDSRFEMMKRLGLWEQPHPWLECLLPYEKAMELLPQIISQLPLSLGDGHRIMPLANIPHPRFSMQPEGDLAIVFAILPTIHPSGLNAALESLQNIHKQLIEAGGKRYLSGWLFEPNEAAWQQHYGIEYQAWQSRKRSLDPNGVLRSCLHP
ncbi:MAG: FAD-binding oxidoreductase [Cyanobacteria bacterium P01_E01_bin.42]